MNTPWKIIAEMASNDSRLVKESIVTREATAKNNEFFKGLNLCQKLEKQATITE